MICPVCEKETSFHSTHCECCGQDLTVYKKAVSASNVYYNMGLEKAKVRDLSGAIEALKKSLRFNKRNTDARNLLGLVYYETGEVVEALSQWVLSKNFQPENNASDRYMKAVQKNASILDNFNQAIKKYNIALSYAKQGSDDLAVMQLEKAVSLNPKFIRSYQLLALLYMKDGEYKKAAKNLKKAKKLDCNNTLTLKYIGELPAAALATEEKTAKEHPRILPEQDISPQAFSQGSYKEEKVNFWPYLNLLIGALLGILVVYQLIVPTVRKDMVSQYEDQFKTFSDQIAGERAKADQLAIENADLQESLDLVQGELDELKANGLDEKAYNNFYDAIWNYMEGDKEKAADRLSNVNSKAIDNAKAKKIYQKIKDTTFLDAAEELAEEGRNVYNSGKYEEAIELLQKALEMDNTNVKAIYFLGRAYHRTGEYEKAREYYNEILEKYPDSDRVTDATRRLQELGNQ